MWNSSMNDPKQAADFFLSVSPKQVVLFQCGFRYLVVNIGWMKPWKFQTTGYNSFIMANLRMRYVIFCNHPLNFSPLLPTSPQIYLHKTTPLLHADFPASPHSPLFTRTQQ